MLLWSLCNHCESDDSPLVTGVGSRREETLRQLFCQRTRRGWHKLHLAVDAHSAQVDASMLAQQEVDNPSQVGPLLEHITANAAYDGEMTYETSTRRDPSIPKVTHPVSTAADGLQ